MTYTAYQEKQVRKKKLLRNNEYYNMQSTLDMLYEKGLNNCKFKKLMQYITRNENILLAYRNIKTNKGARTCGVDNINIFDVKSTNINEFVKRIKGKFINYIPKSVRRVEIPKPNGKTRPIGISTIEDRIIQQCIKQVLEPICESKFYKHSYGFRPNRSTQHAMATAYGYININKLLYTVDIDIKGFFDNVNHGKLLKQLWNIGIRDKCLLSIIGKILKTEIKDIGIPTKGVPQGGVLSPLLSNVVLNELDWWLVNQWDEFKTIKEYATRSTRHIHLKKYSNLKEFYIVRYADDVKLFCRDYNTANKVFLSTKKWLKERLKLDISEEKSNITNLRKNYTEFLGFKLKARLKRKNYHVCKSHVCNRAKIKIINNLKDKIFEIKKHTTIKNVNNLNSAILGIHNYYKTATNVNVDFRRINFLVRTILYNRLRMISKFYRGEKGRAHMKFYREYKGITQYILGISLFPIYGVKTKPPMKFQPKICNYTQEGRKLIHDKLKTIDFTVLKYIMENPIEDESNEYNDNRISKYTSQNGRCYVTGERLRIGDMECHHKKPKKMGGTDKFNNLIFLKKNIHKLVHVKDEEAIKGLLCIEMLNKSEINSLNKLRKIAGNCVIDL